MMSLHSMLLLAVVALASGDSPATSHVNSWVNEANSAAAEFFSGDSSAFDKPQSGLIASSSATSATSSSNLRFWKGMHMATGKVNAIKTKKEAAAMKPAESA